MATFNTTCNGSGCNNPISGECNAIGGGGENCITAINPGRGVYSGILGGRNNEISDGGFSSIVGGCANTISAGTTNSNYSAILGGADNQISGCYSAILGGSGNSDSGYNYVGIFGQNVVAVTGCAFHANTFVAQNIPVVPNAFAFALLPNGSLYIPATSAIYLGQPLYIK